MFNFEIHTKKGENEQKKAHFSVLFMLLYPLSHSHGGFIRAENRKINYMI